MWSGFGLWLYLLWQNICFGGRGKYWEMCVLFKAKREEEALFLSAVISPSQEPSEQAGNPLGSVAPKLCSECGVPDACPKSTGC